MSRIFVTGGSGFIGTNLIQSLIAGGNRVVNYDIKSPRNVIHSSVWIRGDVLELDTLVKEIGKFNPEYFVHLAARTDLNGINVAEYPANTDGVLNIVNATGKCDSLKRVLFASSRLVCKIGYSPKADDDYCPSTFYGESKVIGETIVRKYAYKNPCIWTILRPTSIWGPWFDTPYKEFFMSILRRQYIHPIGRHIKKSFGYVGNSVYMIEKLLFCDPLLVDKKTLYLADYPPIEVKQWADLIASKSGRPKPLELPEVILNIIALLGDLFKKAGWKSPPLTSFRLNNLLTDMVYDTKELEHICGELLYSVDEGVQETLNWLGI
jgi:nucleoside-diphosphate-sugar epimerase